MAMVTSVGGRLVSESSDGGHLAWRAVGFPMSSEGGWFQGHWRAFGFRVLGWLSHLACPLSLCMLS